MEPLDEGDCKKALLQRGRSRKKGLACLTDLRRDARRCWRDDQLGTRRLFFLSGWRPRTVRDARLADALLGALPWRGASAHDPGRVLVAGPGAPAAQVDRALAAVGPLGAYKRR